MNRILLISLMTLFVSSANVLKAQRYDWVSFTPTTGSNGSGSRAMAMDDEGFIYTISKFEGTMEIGQETLEAMGFGFTDFAIIQWNSNGEPLNHVHLYSTGFNDVYKMIFDSDYDHLIVSFYEVYSFTISGGPSINTGGYPVVRFTTDLNYVSSLPNFPSYNVAIASKDSALYVSGGYSSTIKRYDANNQAEWSLSPSTGNFNVGALALNNDSVLYAMGYFMEQLTVTFGDSSMTPPPVVNGQDVGIVKMDTAGVVMDAFYLARSQSYIYPLLITTDSEGYVYVACAYSVGQTLGDFTIPQSSSANDVFVAKLSRDLEFIWVTTFQNQGNMECRDMVIMEDGTLAVTGFYGGIGTFGTYVFDEPNPYGMCYMVLLNSETGQIDFADRFGTTNGTSRPYEILASGQNLYISGLLFSSATTEGRFGCYTEADRFLFLTKFTNEPFEQPVIALTMESTLLSASTNLQDAVFEWTLNGEVIQGETSSTYAPQQTGTYTVSVSTYGCVASDTFVITVLELGGCMNVSACNYNDLATFDDGSCIFPGDACDDGNPLTVNDEVNELCICLGQSTSGGCTDMNACNYNNLATTDDGSCLYLGESCDDGNAETINDVINGECSCAGTTNVLGCMDMNACNYNSSATTDDGSCLYLGESCDDGNAGTINDIITGDCSCAGIPNVLGCTDIDACNFNVEALTDDGSCLYLGDTCDDGDEETINDVIAQGCLCSGVDIVLGCTDEAACNFNSAANTDDASCIFVGDSCDDGDPDTENDIVGQDCLCAGIVGIEDVSENGITVYPNPASEVIWIEVSADLIGNHVQVYHLDGKLLHSERISGNRQMVDLGAYAAGVYRLVIRNAQNEEITSRTFMKN